MISLNKESVKFAKNKKKLIMFEFGETHLHAHVLWIDISIGLSTFILILLGLFLEVLIKGVIDSLAVYVYYMILDESC